MDLSRHRPALIATAILAVAILLALSWARNIARRDFVEPPPFVPAPSASPITKSQAVTLLEGKVTVTAEVLEDGFWIARIKVSGGGASFSSESYGYASHNQSKDDFLASLRRQTGWNADVLFVPHSCGGGNAWRCNLQLLYRITGGKLIELGSVEAGPEGQPPGSTFHDGVIEDSFDLLETNSLTSHAAAPWFTIVLRVTPEHLVPDADRTWERNAWEYRNNETRLTCTGPGCEPIVDPEERAGLLLHNAALAKYTGREYELTTAIALAEQNLDEMQFKAFKKELGLVKPSALMTSFLPERPPPR